MNASLVSGTTYPLGIAVTPEPSTLALLSGCPRPTGLRLATADTAWTLALPRRIAVDFGIGNGRFATGRAAWAGGGLFAFHDRLGLTDRSKAKSWRMNSLGFKNEVGIN